MFNNMSLNGLLNKTETLNKNAILSYNIVPFFLWKIKKNRHCLLGGGTQSRACMKRVGIKPATTSFLISLNAYFILRFLNYNVLSSAP